MIYSSPLNLPFKSSSWFKYVTAPLVKFDHAEMRWRHQTELKSNEKQTKKVPVMPPLVRTGTNSNSLMRWHYALVRCDLVPFLSSELFLLGRFDECMYWYMTKIYFVLQGSNSAEFYRWRQRRESAEWSRWNRVKMKWRLKLEFAEDWRENLRSESDSRVKNGELGMLL